MVNIYILLILSFISVNSFGALPMGAKLVKSAVNKNGFGENNRATTVSFKNKNAINFIGKLLLAKGGYCTASLVGKDLILTNAHCLAKDGELVKGNYRFQLGYNRGTFRAESETTHAWYGTLTPENNNFKSDWAILKLAIPLGDDYGYFGVTKDPNITLPVTVGGYGKLFSRTYVTVHEECSFKWIEHGSLLHDCDISAGDSGSPMFRCEEGRCYIKALQSAERRNGRDDSAFLEHFSSLDSNIAVQTLEFYDKLVELKELAE